jgi:LysM repeat protein
MRFFSFLIFVLFCFSCVGQDAPKSSADTSAYPWLKPELNFVQFYQKQAIANFYKIWKEAKNRKISVLMFGDSHLQHGAYPDQIRKRLQEKFGYAGQGLVFAFSAANTYSNTDYKTSHTGTWVYAKSFMNTLKLPLGVSGMSIRTEKLPASLSFSPKINSWEKNNVLKLFFRKSPESFQPVVVIDETTEIPITWDSTDTKPFVRVAIPAIKQKITIKLQKNDTLQRFFEFYGMTLETEPAYGVILHNAGVGAAKYGSVLRKQLLAEQLPHFQPDLVVLDFGTNDYLYNDKISDSLERQIREIIAKIRQICPKTTILLTTAQDLYWRRINVKSGLAFSELIQKIASETNCLLYDWYWVAGGQTVMRDWVKAKIAQNDMVHLNEAGYRLKGNLFYEALASTMRWIDENPTKNQLVLATDSLKAQQAHFQRKRIYAYNYASKPKTNKKQDTAKTPVVVVKQNSSAKSKTLTHTVVAGDTLYALAARYKVSVAELMQWNALSSSNLRIGQVLIVRK